MAVRNELFYGAFKLTALPSLLAKRELVTIGEVYAMYT